MTDHVTDHYIQECLGGNDALLNAMSSASFPEAFFASCGKRLLPRPFFIGESEMLRCADDLTALFHLLVSLPDRLFDGDVRRYCRALGIDERRADLITRFPGPPSLYGRADLYHDGDSFKLLEYNINSALGGTDRAEIPRRLLDVDAVREFAEKHRLGYVYTAERVARTLHAAAEPITGGTNPVVAFVEADGGLATYMHLVLSFQEMLGQFGIEVVLGEVSDVKSGKDRLFLHGRPIDLMLRYFTDDEIVATPGGVEAVEPILRAHEEGKVVIWTTTRDGLVYSKGCLALVSDERARETFSGAERALVDRILPWTRTLTGGTTEVGGDTVRLLDHCRENREDLILKPFTGYGGDGIVAGWEVTDREWREALTRGCDRDHVVQRRVVPRHEPVVDPETGAVENWVAAWDAFLTPEGYAGSHIRALPAGDRAVINMGASGAARTSGVFYYPSPGGDRK